MYQTAGYYYYEERTAAKAAAFLHTLELGADTFPGRTGVRADWMEQDGPALFSVGKKGLVGDNGHPAASHIRTTHMRTPRTAHHIYGAASAVITDEGAKALL